MRILVLGGGGREHALVERLAGEGGQIYCAPGNPGTATLAQSVAIDPGSAAEVATWSQRNGIELVVCGPEGPLAAGVGDTLRENGTAFLGPSRAPARLETSKIFAKEFMQREGIATARGSAFGRIGPALAHLQDCAFPVVIKADGLAAGKGVTIARNIGEAEAAVSAALVDRAFGAAGARVLVEEFLPGRELSAFCLTDGRDLVMLPFARDYKRAHDGDRGPNTGSMGSCAGPLGPGHRRLAARIETEVFTPAITALARAGTPYVGFLYAGLVLTEQGPKVLEFNARLGDPEAQTILRLITGEFARACQLAATGHLADAVIGQRGGYSVCVAVASGGYPGAYRTGHPISIDDARLAASRASLFHAGTACRAGQLVSAGGRVFSVVADGDTLADARERTYAGLSAISFARMEFRSDIAAEALDLPDQPRG